MLGKFDFRWGGKTYSVVSCNCIAWEVISAVSDWIARRKPVHDIVIALLCNATMRMAQFLNANDEVLKKVVPPLRTGKLLHIERLLQAASDAEHSPEVLAAAKAEQLQKSYEFDAIRWEQHRIWRASKAFVRQLVETDSEVRRALIEIAWALDFSEYTWCKKSREAENEAKAENEAEEVPVCTLVQDQDPIISKARVARICPLTFVCERFEWTPKQGALSFCILDTLGFLSHSGNVLNSAFLNSAGVEWLAEVDPKQVLGRKVADWCIALSARVE